MSFIIKAKKNHQPSIHLNLNVRGLPQSATLYINETSYELLRQGRRIFRFGLGQSPFPVPRPVVEELRANAHQKEYLPVMGLRELRGGVAEYYLRTQGVNFTPDNVMIGPGSKELMFLLQLVYYGDLVVPTPSWVSYAPQAHILGRHIRWLETSVEDGWRLTPESLEQLCARDPDRPRLVVLNYPANPGGCTYRAETLKAIARIARRYRVVLLSDEIYGELHHKGRHVSVARFYPEGTIISSGLSKWCGAGGWRLGTFAFPKSLDWLKEAMAVVASETYTSTSSPIQYAAVRAFQSDLEIQQYLLQCRRILRSLGRSLARQLRDANVEVPEPQGGFYLFPDFTPFRDLLRKRGILTSNDLCTRLLDEIGIAILPGTAFGGSPDDLTARIAYVDFDGARALTAAEEVPLHRSLDKSFLETHCPSCIEGIGRLCEWLHD